MSLSTPRNCNNEAWEYIHDTLCRERGVDSLCRRKNHKEDCLEFLRGSSSTDDCLDLVELSFFYLEAITSKYDSYERKARGIQQEASSAIDELNIRFREAGVGYQFTSGKIIRVDSDLIHAEVVKPALQFLSDPRFSGPQQEFLDAHAHYRAGECKDAITDALNAFESTLKTICDLKGWTYNKGARASDLIKLIRSNGLLPDYLDNSFDQLIGTLKSGLPKVRNEEGAHGQGSDPKRVPDFVAAYALHLAAAKVVMLVEAFRESEN